MKTASKLLAVGLLFVSSAAYGASDRFGNARNEVPRTHYTATTDANVIIASITPANVTYSSMTPASGGSLIIRSVIFSGIIPSTVSFHDGHPYTTSWSTIAVLNYIPDTKSGISGVPTQVWLDMAVSTAIAYNKVGLTPVIIKWDWLSPRKSGDDRN